VEKDLTGLRENLSGLIVVGVNPSKRVGELQAAKMGLMGIISFQFC
jgi:hypothetical protein